jgi:L-alanine-DL-glutamate epimerase-like enolase superfamily enzyme
MNRRQFLQSSAGVVVGASLSRFARGAEPTKAPGSTVITHVSVQVAKGRRLTPVAPNAYKGYRGYDVNEPVLRIRTADGLEGIGRQQAKPETVKQLLGLDLFKLFDWDGSVVRGPAEPHAKLLDELGGSDVALFDLLGKTMQKPIADLLGPRVRESATVYDSSLYMEDLLKPEEREGAAYLKGVSALPDDPAELVALKAKWVLSLPGDIRVLKIKLGRVKWMGDMQKAVDRDIAVIKAIRKAVGPDVVLFVDGNDGYDAKPLAAVDFALATKDERVYAMEEMFNETKHVAETREEKQRIRAAGLTTKLADGENDRDGISDAILAERVGDEPLFDIDQPDMNQNGYLRMAAIARRAAKHGLKVAPHNFGSKWGFYSMVHSGLTTPNWEFCESDDTQIPALRPEGIKVEKGKVTLTGMPGVGVVLDESKLDQKPVFAFNA